jgi:hypothetical protein
MTVLDLAGVYRDAATLICSGWLARIVTPPPRMLGRQQ